MPPLCSFSEAIIVLKHILDAVASDKTTGDMQVDQEIIIDILGAL